MSVESFRYCGERKVREINDVGAGATYLVSEDKCTEEDALVRPLFEGNLDVWLGTLDVDEGDQEGRDLDLRLVKDVRGELEELGLFRVTRHGAATDGGGGRWASHGVVDGLNDCVN